MYISVETPEQTEVRLRHVMQLSNLVWHEGTYGFHEYPVAEFPAGEVEQCLALVRDTDVWSVLKRVDSDALESFGLFSVHFPSGVDNSGFVGWLATIMKRELGTGVFVVCGHNLARGGIFDYWGIPLAKREEASKVLLKLRRGL